MKWISEEDITNLPESRPARGGWIEIERVAPFADQIGSRPARGGWIEIKLLGGAERESWSRPARGGWIEMKVVATINEAIEVPPHKGRVD